MEPAEIPLDIISFLIEFGDLERSRSTGEDLEIVLCVAPTAVRCEFLKSSFFVVAVFLWSSRVVIVMNMHRKATRTPHMVPWGWGEGRKKYFCIALMFYEKNLFQFKLLAEL